MLKDYNFLKTEILKKKISLEKAIEASHTNIVTLDDIEISKTDAINLKENFQNFLDSDTNNFKRIFIPLSLISKNIYWKKLQCLCNQVYEEK